MSRRWKRKPANDYGKWEKEAISVTAKIIKIELQNEPINDKFKTVFYVESKKHPEGRMCVIWGRTTFNEGDVLYATGRIKDEVFLIWSYLYKPSEAKEAAK